MIFSPSIEAVYAKHPMELSDILARVSRLGFNAFEFWAWWNKNIDELQGAIETYGLTVASFCTKFVSLVDPSQRHEYYKGLVESISVAKRLNCQYLISQVGAELPEVSRLKQWQSIVDGLRDAAPLLEENGVTLIVEPLNVKVDHPGYFLVSSSEAFDIIDAVDSPNVKLVFDIYHQQVSEGNLIPNITNNFDKIAYFHVADHPGRHELGTGEINFTNVFRAINQAGYRGYVGLEYFPLGNPDTSLAQVLTQYGQL